MEAHALTKTGDVVKIETLATVPVHQAGVFKRVAIAMENTLWPNGFNVGIGGGTKDTYDKLRHDVLLVKNLVLAWKNVSYDILFMRGDISLTEDEFDAVKRLTLKREETGRRF